MHLGFVLIFNDSQHFAMDFIQDSLPVVLPVVDLYVTGEHRESVELLANSIVSYAVSEKARCAVCSELCSRSLLTLVKWLQVRMVYILFLFCFLCLIGHKEKTLIVKSALFWLMNHFFKTSLILSFGMCPYVRQPVDCVCTCVHLSIH